jgi:hypothetical protein
MAQTFPTSAQVIYETLSTDSNFTNLLGTYNFKGGGGPIDAISVVTAGADIPSLRNVEGVECVIQDAGNSTLQEYYGSTVVVTTWSVFLIAWGEATGADLQAAAEVALKRFRGSEMLQTVATSDGLGSLVQTKLLIKSNMPILAV